MSDTKKLNEGIVAALEGNDLVLAADANGKLRPVTLDNLLAAVRGSIKVGGRNLVKGTSTPLTTIELKTYELTADLSKEPAGSEITLSFRYEFSGITLGDSPRFGIQTAVKDMGGWKFYADCYFYPTSANGKGRAVAVKTLPAGMDISTPNIQAFIQRVSGGTVKLYDIKLERGNVATDWTPAPEDVLTKSGGGKTRTINCLCNCSERRCAA